MEGRERAQASQGGGWVAVGSLSSGLVLGWGLAALGWDSGRVVPGDSLNPMSGFGCNDDTLNTGVGRYLR